MSYRWAQVPLVAFALLLCACAYIVLPEGLEDTGSADSRGWSGVPTRVEQTASGDLRIEVTIRNLTGDWSAMSAEAGKPALLTSGGGQAANCQEVFVGTGGHRLAPGFQMRGYTTGTKAEPKIQLLYVICTGAEAAPGSKLAINYVSYSGVLDYYHQEEGKATGTLEIDLDQIAADLTYPVFEAVEGLVQPADVTVPAISDNSISMLDVQRIDTGFEFTWQNFNPTEFALKTHIGNPPVICSDGIVYGLFEIMDLASVPLTPAGGKVEWNTKVAVPQDVSGCYILLSVESKQMRLYVSHAVDISDR